ncbi:MAG: hypothetical protein HC771_01450 [Synechococcales cyanobacterium CRU_2_2]|nr:hypothetical protein [Synechococcales cyanobacterium CRU_2_2]
MSPFPHGPGIADVRHLEERLSNPPSPEQPLNPIQQAQLQGQINSLLEQFSIDEISLCLQRSYNHQPGWQRQGTEIQIRLLSESYQRGGYDDLF